MAVKSLIIEVDATNPNASQTNIDQALSDNGVDKADFIDALVITQQVINQTAVILILYDG